MEEFLMMSRSSEEIEETGKRPESSEEMSVNVEAAILNSIRTGMYRYFRAPQESQAKKDTSFTIHRVPQEMRVGADSCQYFVPKCLFVGPVHRGNTELRGEIEKWENLGNLFFDDQKSLEEMIKKVSNTIVTEARKCYDKQLVESLDDETLGRIMVLDGLFVIHIVLWSNIILLWGAANVPDIVSKGQDFLMLENQIPFSVLECLFDYVRPKIRTFTFSTFMLPAHEYLAVIYRLSFSSTVPEIQTPAGPFHHLLHMFHSTLLPQSHNTDDDEDSCWYWFVSRFIALLSKWWWRLAESLPCYEPASPTAEFPRRALQSATQLLEAGVKFKKTQEERRRSVIDVRFRRGYIEIPRLPLQSWPVSLLLNLLAFEKCMPECGNHITVYLAFMNSLIDTAKDVDLLVSSGVLENKLGSDEDVAHFFNTAVDDKSVFLKFEKKGHYLRKMFEDLDAYCAKPRHRYRAKLERDYLSSPWSLISLIAGTLLLILTVAQTIIAYYSYFRPPKI